MREAVNEKELTELGERIGASVRGGQVIELVGDVGAGKTTLTKAIARGMGIDAPTQSPTFMISNRYKAPGGLKLVHYDFYRLNDGGVMSDELAETINEGSTVTVVEWGGIIEDVLPLDRLTIHLTPTSDAERDLVLNAHGPKSQKLKEDLE